MKPTRTLPPLHIMMPVKDAIESAIPALRAVMASDLPYPHTFTVYDDFSSEANAQQLDSEAEQLHFRVVHLRDVTAHPSPNYRLALQLAQKEALTAGASLAIVESDVTVQPDTLLRLMQGATERPDCGIAASVTTDEHHTTNYPYLYAKDWEPGVHPVKKHCSFCCSLLTPALLQAIDFNELDTTKDWFDVTISRLSRQQGLTNYLFTNLPVVHKPHSSRPWKQLKYTHPLKYYWHKWVKGKDKI